MAISAADSALLDQVKLGFEALVKGLEFFLFFPVFGFPMVVMWMVVAGVYFTFRLGVVNIRLFPHALQVIRGKYSREDDPGEITHFAAVAAALSGSVGLGNIAGVAFAVAAGGPGAVIWMMVAAFFGMALKFAEVTLGHKYRQIDAQGKVTGGAFLYLRDGLAARGWPKSGKLLAALFGVCCIGGSLGGGNMLQSNQAISMLLTSFPSLAAIDWVLALVLAILVGVVLIGGIRRIARVAEMLVPSMAIIYILACLVVLVANAEQVPAAFAFMLHQAFTPEAAGGGMLGAMIMGFRRAYFSNEAGIGSAPIAHATTKTTEPAREGSVAMLEPLVDTVIVCCMTGIVITVSGVYAVPNMEKDGAVLTAAAFATVLPWFPLVLTVCIQLFAFSTMITWSYYGERAWSYLTRGRWLNSYYFIFCTAAFLGALMDFGAVVDFSDMLILVMALPNLLGLYLLQGEVASELKSYYARGLGREPRQV
jgi:AGCS family alanine or glycine:cation symporter